MLFGSTATAQQAAASDSEASTVRCKQGRRSFSAARLLKFSIRQPWHFTDVAASTAAHQKPCFAASCRSRLLQPATKLQALLADLETRNHLVVIHWYCGEAEREGSLAKQHLFFLVE